MMNSICFKDFDVTNVTLSLIHSGRIKCTISHSMGEQ